MSSLQERIKLLQEEFAAMINERSSRSPRTLTVFRLVAFPIKLIAGLFGMNIAGIPQAQHEHGFWLVAGGLAGRLRYFAGAVDAARSAQRLNS